MMRGYRRGGWGCIPILLVLAAFIVGFLFCFQVIYRILLYWDYTDYLPHTRNKWGFISYIARDAVKASLGVMVGASLCTFLIYRYNNKE